MYGRLKQKNQLLRFIISDPRREKQGALREKQHASLIREYLLPETSGCLLQKIRCNNSGSGTRDSKVFSKTSPFSGNERLWSGIAKCQTANQACATGISGQWRSGLKSFRVDQRHTYGGLGLWHSRALGTAFPSFPIFGVFSRLFFAAKKSDVSSGVLGGNAQLGFVPPPLTRGGIEWDAICFGFCLCSFWRNLR